MLESILLGFPCYDFLNFKDCRTDALEDEAKPKFFGRAALKRKRC